MAALRESCESSDFILEYWSKKAIQSAVPGRYFDRPGSFCAAPL
jgi:hypothetical protein